MTGPSMPPLAASAPTIAGAVGLVGVYLLIQVALGMLGVELARLLHDQPAAGSGIPATAQFTLQPGATTALAVVAVSVAALAVLLLVRWRWPTLWSRALPPGFGFSWPRHPTWLLTAAIAGLLAPWLGGLITQVLAHGHEVSQNVGQLARHAPPAGRVALALLAVGVAPMAEELLFRGVLLSALLARWGMAWAAGLSAGAFAVIHLPGLGWHWYALPQLLLLGLVLVWLRMAGRSLWPAVVAHGMQNALALGVLFSGLGAAG